MRAVRDSGGLNQENAGIEIKTLLCPDGELACVTRFGMCHARSGIVGRGAVRR